MSDKLAKNMMEYLDCPCRYFKISGDEQELITAYYDEIAQRGKCEGFVPVIISVEDTLWECLKTKAGSGGKGKSYQKEKVAEFRKKMLSSPLGDGKEILSRLMGESQEDEEDVSEDDVETNTKFRGYRYCSGVIVAEIPTKNPWEIFAWLPFGGWNSCPDTPELMAVAKYWYEQYGAMPAVVTHDVLEYKVQKPVEPEAAMALAREHYALCPDGDEGAAIIAAALKKATVWLFWWD